MPADDLYVCATCRQVYPVINGIWDALPKISANLKYLNWYEEEGVADDKTGAAKLNAQRFKVPNVLTVLPECLTARTCLDVGCGGGWFLEEFLKRLPAPPLAGSPPIKHSFGIDISLPRLREARRILAGTTLIRGDVESIPLADDSIDLVIALDVIEHIEHPEMLLKEIRRLAPHLVIKFPIEDTFFERFRAKLQWLKRVIRNRPPLFNPHLHCFTVKKAYQLLGRAGFEVKNKLLIDLPFGETFMYPPAYGITEQTPLAQKMDFHIKRFIIKSLSQLAYLFLAPFFSRLCNCGLYVYAMRSKRSSTTK